MDGGCVAMVAGCFFFFFAWERTHEKFILTQQQESVSPGAARHTHKVWCFLHSPLVRRWLSLYTAQLLKFLSFNNISYPVSLLSLFLELAWKAPSPIGKIYYISEGPFKMCVNLKVWRERRANSQRELLCHHIWIWCYGIAKINVANMVLSCLK